MIRMVYNRQSFRSTAEFMEAFNNGTLKRSTHPDEDAKSGADLPGDETWATRERKGNKRELDERAGPKSVSFDGPRYKVDKKEGFVSWRTLDKFSTMCCRISDETYGYSWVVFLR